VRAALGVLADVCCVLAFVVIGRANHHAGGSLAGMTSTAWPFLVGLAVGEVVTRAWRRPAALGQVLRAVSGQGTDLVFIGVSALFLGLFLIGWRLVAVRILAVRSQPAGRDGRLR
jgi:hypothetical protein